MPKQKNIASVAKLKEKLEKAKSLVLTDYTGLTHKQLELLHKNVKNVGAEFVVVKNSLLKIASSATNYQLPTTNSVGPTAVLFSYNEDLAALKELFKFIKTNALPKVKMSWLEDKEYDAAQTATIAALPDRNSLIAQLMFVLNTNTRKLAYLLTQIKKS